MSKFVIEPHFRLQEWVAEEKGYLGDEGLEYEFREFIRSTDGAVGAYITMQPLKMRRPTLSINEIITDAPLAAKQYLKVMARQITWTQN